MAEPLTGREKALSGIVLQAHFNRFCVGVF